MVKKIRQKKIKKNEEVMFEEYYCFLPVSFFFWIVEG